jgi:hypothetical protein
MEEIGSDIRVNFVAPIYFRDDLNHPNGFTYDNKIIIRSKKDVGGEDLQTFIAMNKLKTVKSYASTSLDGLKVLQSLDQSNERIYEIAQKLNKLEYIKWATVNWIQLHSSLHSQPNDPKYGNQWNLKNTTANAGTANCDINVEPAWNVICGSPLIVIAILDRGFWVEHPDLIPNLVQPERFYNIPDDSNTVEPNGDFPDHGTGMAGIASAATNNFDPQGIAGIGYNCRIMPIIAFNLDDVGSVQVLDIMNSLLKAKDNRANVISMSFGLDMDLGIEMEDTLEECKNAGIVIVASVGNQYKDTVDYPAYSNHVIAVGASDENDNVWCASSSGWGSNYGDQLSVFAPGSKILTTTQQHPSGVEPYFEYIVCTSGAAPHVAGLAALMLSYNPTLSPEDIHNIMKNTADPVSTTDPAVAAKIVGKGRINAGKAMADVISNHNYDKVDVYIRNSLTDNGEGRYNDDPLYWSPDIIVRQKSIDPEDRETELGDYTIDPGSENVVIGENNYIYIRVHNKLKVNEGDDKESNTTDVHVRVYYAPLSTNCAREHWEYIGQLDIYDVVAGDHRFSDELVWNAPDPGYAGHFCIIASIEGVQDPHPDPRDISNAHEYMEFIRTNNNICYRNVFFEHVLSDSVFSFNFFFTGFPDEKDFHKLRIKKKTVVKESKVLLELPRSIIPNEVANLDNMVEKIKKATKHSRSFELNKAKVASINNLLPLKRELIKVEVKIPANAKPNEVYEFSIEDVVKDDVVGDLHFLLKVVDPKNVKYIGLRDKRAVHKINCNHLERTNRQSWVTFDSIRSALYAGYDKALDCLNTKFTAKAVSFKLAPKVVEFINRVVMPDQLNRFVMNSLGRDYFISRYGLEEAKKRNYGLLIDQVIKIINARSNVGRFTKLEQIEKINGVSNDTLIDIVNAFKQ